MKDRAVPAIALLVAAALMVTCVAMDRRAVAAQPCHGGDAPRHASSDTSSRAVAAKFARLYRAWHRESRDIQFSSRTSDYIALPSYRQMIALGPAAVPLLEQKLSQDRDADFMLADAVVQICGWNPADFASYSAQAFRDMVLRRLRGI